MRRGRDVLMKAMRETPNPALVTVLALLLFLTALKPFIARLYTLTTQGN